MTNVEITFGPSNQIKKIVAEDGLTIEEFLALGFEIEDDPLWAQSPADRQSDSTTTQEVEI